MTHHNNSDIAARRKAMEACAHASAAELERVLEGLGCDDAEDIRAPEIGLIMARGRIGGTGAPFNVGEVSVTRAACRLATGWIGHAYHLGRDKTRARLAARIDAAWQSPLRDEVEHRLGAIRARIAEDRNAAARRAAATRVDFFTMVRGED